jgi:regulator of protease activity HflC (stomatin/prohibitin superfamily)
MPPPSSISGAIADKAAAEYDALKWVARAKAADAEKEQKIAVARGDSAAVVIAALAEAEATRLRQKQLTPLFIEYLKIQKWDGALPTTATGNGSSLMLNVK